MTKPMCADCGSEMERGFIPDFSYGSFHQMGWYKGEPEAQRVFGFETSAVQVNRNESVPITAYRCTDCGLLKFYANVPEVK